MHTEMTEWVAAELDFDPKVDSDPIGGRRRRNAVRHGEQPWAEAHQAQNAARRVGGVRRIGNELQVRIPHGDGRPDSDGDLRGAVILAAGAQPARTRHRRCQGPGGLVTVVGTADGGANRTKAGTVRRL